MSRIMMMPSSRICAPRAKPAPARLPVAAPARRSRTSAVRVLAFKESSRSERLTLAARDFIEFWAQGTRSTSGPTEQGFVDIKDLVAPDVHVQAVHPLGNVEFKGLDGLRKKMVLDATFKSSMRPNRVLLCAADEAEAAVFCLLECEEMGSMDEDVNIVLLELHCVGKTYGIVKLDIALDEDGTSKVTGVTERMQLGPADACLLTMLYPDHKLHETMEEDQRAEKEAAGQVALQMASTWHFPREHIRAKGLQGEAAEVAKHNMHQWSAARSSGADHEAIISKIVDPKRFGLWDPYGVLPTVCGIRDKDGDCTYKGIEADSYANTVMTLGSVLNRLSALKVSHHIDCQHLDAALCPHHNVGFSHWRSVMCHQVHTAKGTIVDREHEYVIEGMAVHIFNTDGSIKDTWMLRDPYEQEKELMQQVCATGSLPNTWSTGAGAPFHSGEMQH